MTNGNFQWFGQLGKGKIKGSITGHPTLCRCILGLLVPGAFASTQVLSEKKNAYFRMACPDGNTSPICLLFLIDFLQQVRA